jgi:histidinol dehydrogenase
MKIYDITKVNKSNYRNILKRPISNNDSIYANVKSYIEKFKVNPEKTLKEMLKQFDNLEIDDILKLKVDEEKIQNSEKLISDKEKAAIQKAYENIYNFHIKQFPQNYSIKYENDSYLMRKYLPINNVGLYIPGGTAILPSTVLMLGIPSQIAKCPRVVLTSPVKNNSDISAYILYAAKLCGITEIYKIGGIQAIALLAYGLETKIDKVDKIFGPGNSYVTAAKLYVANDINSNCAIDMPAGPSEVLVIADEFANPDFIAADLLSQAEHGLDSQVVLLSTSDEIIKKVLISLNEQVEYQERKDFIKNSLENSIIIKVNTLEEAFEISNEYAPEHLILNIKNFENYIDLIKNAGSVFLGQYSPESFGDYAAGTNHSLPTNGYAKAFSGIGVEAFMKSITFQYHSKKAFYELSETVEILADIEQLPAHKNAVTIRKKGE